MNTPAKLCSNKDCKVQTTGKCHLNHDPVESCPHYAHADKVVDPELDVDTPTAAPPAVEIASSDVMNLADLAQFMRRRIPRVVALVGEHKAGKTTLISSVYEAYCKGPFAGLTFAGSKTLVGFAKLHAFALLNSGRLSPTVPRTSRNDPIAFFHMALARSRRDIIDLVIADRSGETYAAARTSTDVIPSLEELYLADRVCFLLDGARLASKERRPAYARQFKQMIHAFHDNGALANAPALEVLSTKFDITQQGDEADQMRFLDDYEKQIVPEFASSGLEITCHRICALPKADRSVGIVGLDDMIARWTRPMPSMDVRPVPLDNTQRQFNRLLARV
jgi:hypothetical protein